MKPRAVSVYIPDVMAEELRVEAARLERTSTWLVRRAWLLARAEIRAIPSAAVVDRAKATE